MARSRADGAKVTRAPAVDIPEWWTDLALYFHRVYGGDTSEAKLGAALARAVGRATPWSRITVGRFFRKDARRITSPDIADAFRKLYPSLPRYAVVPGDALEAIELEYVHKRAEARRAARGAEPLPQLSVSHIDDMLGQAFDREQREAEARLRAAYADDKMQQQSRKLEAELHEDVRAALANLSPDAVREVIALLAPTLSPESVVRRGRGRPRTKGKRRPSGE